MQMSLNATRLWGPSSDNGSTPPPQTGALAVTDDSNSFASMLRQTQAHSPSAPGMPASMTAQLRAPAPAPAQAQAPAPAPAPPAAPTATQSAAPTAAPADASPAAPGSPDAAPANRTPASDAARGNGDAAAGDPSSPPDPSQATGGSELDRTLLARKLRAADDAIAQRRSAARAPVPGDADATAVTQTSGKAAEAGVARGRAARAAAAETTAPVGLPTAAPIRSEKSAPAEAGGDGASESQVVLGAGAQAAHAAHLAELKGARDDALPVSTAQPGDTVQALATSGAAAAALTTLVAARADGPAAAPDLSVLAAASAAVHTGRADTAAPLAVAVATPVHDPAFAQTLGVQLSVLARDGVQHAELHLNPADMGPVSVKIAMEGTQARVDFGADLAATRHAIEAGIPELASALRDAGFTLAGGGVSQHASGQSGSGGSPQTAAPRLLPNLVSAQTVERVQAAAQRIRGAGGVDVFA